MRLRGPLRVCSCCCCLFPAPADAQDTQVCKRNSTSEVGRLSPSQNPGNKAEKRRAGGERLQPFSPKSRTKVAKKVSSPPRPPPPRKRFLSLLLFTFWAYNAFKVLISANWTDTSFWGCRQLYLFAAPSAACKPRGKVTCARAGRGSMRTRRARRRTTGRRTRRSWGRTVRASRMSGIRTVVPSVGATRIPGVVMRWTARATKRATTSGTASRTRRRTTTIPSVVARGTARWTKRGTARGMVFRREELYRAPELLPGGEVACREAVPTPPI
ncbi:hypothetical protein B484DRAFT_123641 [Ochromonadaceae sp. CCMP2298]|nr:hypothetical protein B484DRAFT_123641 [Ochromonadaceae sp. CCMP2298]